jgi:hypothetical protein
MKKNSFLGLRISAALLTLGLVFAGCENDTTNEGTNGTANGAITLKGYAKSFGVNASVLRSISASVTASLSESDGIYHSSDYRSFPIDNLGGEPVTFRNVTVEAILQFERDVTGYDDDPDEYAGYLSNYSSYPSDARSTGNEGVYLVFDSREPTERYQVGYHHINLNIADSNLEYFENLIGQGKPISIFHINAATLSAGPVTCWVVQWIPESEGGIAGEPF